MAREFRIGPLGIRLFYRKNDLTPDEELAINKIIPEALGYSDKGVEQIAQDYGFASVREMAQFHSFQNPRDFFLGNGWQSRLARYKNGFEIHHGHKIKSKND